MDEEKKKHIAVFRYGVIHEFVSGAELSYGGTGNKSDDQNHQDDNTAPP